jgi:hypothetical protein
MFEFVTDMVGNYGSAVMPGVFAILLGFVFLLVYLLRDRIPLPDWLEMFPLIRKTSVWKYRVEIFERRGQTAQLSTTTWGRFERQKDGFTRKFKVKSDPIAEVHELDNSFISPNRTVMLYNLGKATYLPMYFELGVVKTKVPIMNLVNGQTVPWEIDGVAQTQEVELLYPLPKIPTDEWAWRAMHVNNVRVEEEALRAGKWWERMLPIITPFIMMAVCLIFGLYCLQQYGNVSKEFAQTFAAIVRATPTPMLPP